MRIGLFQQAVFTWPYSVSRDQRFRTQIENTECMLDCKHFIATIRQRNDGVVMPAKQGATGPASGSVVLVWVSVAPLAGVISAVRRMLDVEPMRTESDLNPFWSRTAVYFVPRVGLVA